MKRFDKFKLNESKEKLTDIFELVEKDLRIRDDWEHLIGENKWRLKQIAFSKDGTCVAIITYYYGHV